MRIDDLERDLQEAAAGIAVTPVDADTVRRRAQRDGRRAAAALAAVLVLGAAATLAVTSRSSDEDRTSGVVAAFGARTARMRIVVESTTQGSRLGSVSRTTAEGIFDFADYRSSIRSESTATFSGGESMRDMSRIIRIGEDRWEDIPEDRARELGIDAQWQHSTGVEEGSLVSPKFDAFDPLATAASLGFRMEPGTEADIDGQRVTEHELVVLGADDLNRIEREIAEMGAERPTAQRTEQKATMWLDSRGTIRRIELTGHATSNGSDSIDEVSLDMRIVYDVLELGVDVSAIVAPDPATVIGSDEYDRLLGEREDERAAKECTEGGGTYRRQDNGDGTGERECVGGSRPDWMATTTTTAG